LYLVGWGVAQTNTRELPPGGGFGLVVMSSCPPPPKSRARSGFDNRERVMMSQRVMAYHAYPWIGDINATDEVDFEVADYFPISWLEEAAVAV
jgi:hypothetical protein